jgi:hypothetical protein
MFNSQFRSFLVLVIFFLTCAMPARADQVYQVDGTITGTGNNVCSPSPCSVSVTFSFLFEIYNDPNTGINGLLLPNSASASGSGSLGSLFTFNPGGWSGGNEGYIPIYDSNLDEIDLITALPPLDQPFQDFSTVEWYACHTVTCFTGFLPLQEQAIYGAPPAFNVGFNGAYPLDLSQTVTAIPEPPTILMVMSGMFFVTAFVRRSRGRLGIGI